MADILYRMNAFKHPRPPAFPIVDGAKMAKAVRFHQTLPGYAPAPITSLKSLAQEIGVGEIQVKDESCRFGTNSFKPLGSSFAIASFLAKECGSELTSFESLKESVKALPLRTFATATEGNHGRGLAWSAQMLGQKAAVYMPKGSSLYRLKKIKELGAQAEQTALNYDETVRYVSRLAKEQNWTLVQDTSWEGYTEIPALVMQGYLTIIAEYLEQRNALNLKTPTHMILQAGVGSFGAALAGCLQQLIQSPISFIIVEPTRADCFYQSACASDGKPRNTRGDLSSIMAGLACGVPNPAAWDILKAMADCFVTCPDNVAARGMRILGNPLGQDARIVSGESGAVPLGLLYELCKNPALDDLKKALNLDSSSCALMISTEGDTDPVSYRSICWDGAYPN